MLLLCRHEKHGQASTGCCPGGGVDAGESLVGALHRELHEEVGIEDSPPVEGPVAIVDSIAPAGSFSRKHVVHIIFATDLDGPVARARESEDHAVRGHRLFGFDELEDVVLHPPIQRFLTRWRTGDPTVYLGAALGAVARPTEAAPVRPGARL